MAFSVRVVGVGDAFTAKYHNACLLLEADGTRVLVDAPPALGRALADLSRGSGEAVGLESIDHVIITHLHGDHVGGLEQLLFFQRFVTRRKTKLHAIPEVLASLWDTRLRGGMEQLIEPNSKESSAPYMTRKLTLEDYAEVEPLGPGVSTIGPFQVTWRPTVHHIPTSALKFSQGGRTLGYSADTAFDPGLIEWLVGSDLFFHETNLGVHTPLASLVALPEIQRERMRLIHYPDFHDVDSSPIPCAREGERHDL
ncbi:MBL fold metallo-hydrolase [Chondromyces apiculatus]|uniref:Beta-lactamase domain protein n=1 Tax=Chondromyces apiculatus DSM 436 TaxID=1192034 RepID=A0A017T9L4_9BACT|nr:MBL fold metallo-hydrolase [Chondromyces apiculatus]EYF05311.1 beta-lactamase domain protein [Chondromyces apiculatus DSM 436]